MSTINILNKQGLLSEEDRKAPLVHGCEYLTFETNLDLSKPIKVTMYGAYTKISVQHYSRDLAMFFAWWSSFVMCDLNGFSGFHNVQFDLGSIEIVQDLSERDKLKEAFEAGRTINMVNQSEESFCAAHNVIFEYKTFQDWTANK